MQVWPGRPSPLAATYDGVGTNFAVFSEVAEGVELCLFGVDGREERVPLTEIDGHVWHSLISGVGPGQRYGCRISVPPHRTAKRCGAGTSSTPSRSSTRRCD